MGDKPYKRAGRQNGQMIYLPRRLKNNLVVLADDTVYRVGQKGGGWKRVGKLKQIAGQVM